MTLYYTCSQGHTISTDRIITACPAARHGRPCAGELTETDARGRTKRVAT